ncbi:MAG: glutamate racemase [Patescibacteria group bacterium]
MIGIFDSGVGGLTVAKECLRQLPEYDLVYFGDTARTPYGNKSRDAIIKYALEDADFLIKKGAKLLIVACNTVSALAYDVLKEKYPNVPIFEVITPAVNEALAGTKNHRIGVIGTRATVQSGIYERKLKEAKDVFVESRACPLFVPLIEENWIKHPELKIIARRYLSAFRDHNIDTLILGCTHYPLIKDVIAQRIGKRVRMVDSATALAGKIKKYLEANPEIAGKLGKTGNSEFYVSDLTEQCQCIANRALGKNIKFHQV